MSVGAHGLLQRRWHRWSLSRMQLGVASLAQHKQAKFPVFFAVSGTRTVIKCNYIMNLRNKFESPKRTIFHANIRHTFLWPLVVKSRVAVPAASWGQPPAGCARKVMPQFLRRSPAWCSERRDMRSGTVTGLALSPAGYQVVLFGLHVDDFGSCAGQDAQRSHLRA